MSADTDNGLVAIAQALQQAQLAARLSNPNPRVGCILTDPLGQVIGQGFTQIAGQAHAEVMALRDAAAKGHSTQGATAYVTLEPCSHHGRTGPCCHALVAAGISKVVACSADPNPLVSGNGFARLRAAGVEVQVLGASHPQAVAARELNIGFFSRMIRKTPWVRMKAAASLDGTTALANGQSQWITGETARADGHHWRARACAVLTGIGTVLEDNPRMDARGVDAPRQPHLVVVDSKLQTPLDAALFGPKRKLFVYTAIDDAQKQAQLEAQAATVICLPDARGKVDLAAMLRDLAVREVNELHVEAGSKLNGSLVKAGLVDEFLIYLAPALLGAGRAIADIGSLTQLDQALNLGFIEVEHLGKDLRIRARSPGRDQF